jgi:hypothetical protein
MPAEAGISFFWFMLHEIPAYAGMTNSNSVMPAEAGISFCWFMLYEIPAYAGMTKKSAEMTKRVWE